MITRISDGVSIPRDVTNTAYQLFLYVQAFHQDPSTHQAANVSGQNDKN